MNSINLDYQDKHLGKQSQKMKIKKKITKIGSRILNEDDDNSTLKRPTVDSNSLKRNSIVRKNSQNISDVQTMTLNTG